MNSWKQRGNQEACASIQKSKLTLTEDMTCKSNSTENKTNRKTM